MEDLQVDLYSAFDNPYPFKKKDSKIELLMYPARVKDFFIFHHVSSVLIIDKNSIPDANIIQMSYLEFLIRKNDDENRYMNNLYLLFSIVLKDEKILFKYGFTEDGKPFIILQGEVYDQNDFEKMRRIICEQNLIDMPDESISKEIRDSMEEAQEIRNKYSGFKTASFEDTLVAIATTMGVAFENVYNMTIRKFKKSIERMDNKLHYEIYLSASISGMVEFKDKSFIKHWLSDLKKDPLSGMIPYDKFESKVSGAVK